MFDTFRTPTPCGEEPSTSGSCLLGQQRAGDDCGGLIDRSGHQHAGDQLGMGGGVTSAEDPVDLALANFESADGIGHRGISHTNHQNGRLAKLRWPIR
jgi:hypothetical protein